MPWSQRAWHKYIHGGQDAWSNNEYTRAPGILTKKPGKRVSKLKGTHSEKEDLVLLSCFDLKIPTVLYSNDHNDG